MKKKLNILLVDDDLTILNNLAAYLEDEDYNVIKAHSAEEALDFINKRLKAGSKVIDRIIAIVDIRLPGLNGNELIEKCLRISPDIKFIIHTGSTDYKIPDNLKTLTVISNNIFRKPVYNMNDFVQEIQKLAKD